MIKAEEARGIYRRANLTYNIDKAIRETAEKGMSSRTFAPLPSEVIKILEDSGYTVVQYSNDIVEVRWDE